MVFQPAGHGARQTGECPRCSQRGGKERQANLHECLLLCRWIALIPVAWVSEGFEGRCNSGLAIAVFFLSGQFGMRAEQGDRSPASCAPTRMFLLASSIWRNVPRAIAFRPFLRGASVHFNARGCRPYAVFISVATTTVPILIMHAIRLSRPDDRLFKTKPRRIGTQEIISRGEKNQIIAG